MTMTPKAKVYKRLRCSDQMFLAGIALLIGPPLFTVGRDNGDIHKRAEAIPLIFLIRLSTPVTVVDRRGWGRVDYPVASLAELVGQGIICRVRHQFFTIPLSICLRCAKDPGRTVPGTAAHTDVVRAPCTALQMRASPGVNAPVCCKSFR
jgi:hypothetical protein